jgi:hypothetical protein
MLDKTSGRLKPILGGDFNGEVGAGYDKLWRCVGPVWRPQADKRG